MAAAGGELARLSADAEVAAKPIYPRPGEVGLHIMVYVVSLLFL